MSGRSTWREDYVPYLLDFPHITFPRPAHCPYCQDRPACTLACAEELERVIKQEGSEYIAAFIAEPISGTSCCGLMPPPDYFPTIRAICDRYNILMIIDEVVTAYGRTGLTSALSTGTPSQTSWPPARDSVAGTRRLPRTLVRDEIYDGIYKEQNHYVHGHTYGGNPLSCAVALAVQNYIEDHDLVARSAQMGDLMLEKMQPLMDSPIVSAVRGKGLLTGVEFAKAKATHTPFDPAQGVSAAVVNRAFAKGVLIMPGVAWV